MMEIAPYLVLCVLTLLLLLVLGLALAGAARRARRGPRIAEGRGEPPALEAALEAEIEAVKNIQLRTLLARNATPMTEWDRLISQAITDIAKALEGLPEDAKVYTVEVANARAKEMYNKVQLDVQYLEAKMGPSADMGLVRGVLPTLVAATEGRPRAPPGKRRPAKATAKPEAKTR